MRSRLLDLVTRPAIAGTGAALILRAMTLASRFLLSLLLARMLSPAEMGEYGLLTATLAVRAARGRTRILLVHATRIGAGDAGTARPDHRGPDGPRLGGAACDRRYGLRGDRRRLVSGPPCAVVRRDPDHRAHLAGSNADPDHHLAAGARLYRRVPSRRHLGLCGGTSDVRGAFDPDASIRCWSCGRSAACCRLPFPPVSLSDLPWRELRGYRPDWSNFPRRPVDGAPLHAHCGRRAGHFLCRSLRH